MIYHLEPPEANPDQTIPSYIDYSQYNSQADSQSNSRTVVILVPYFNKCQDFYDFVLIPFDRYEYRVDTYIVFDSKMISYLYLTVVLFICEPALNTYST